MVYIPTLNDDVSNYYRLFKLASDVAESQDDVTFDFSRCFFIRQNGVAFIGGLARLMQSQGRDVHFLWETAPEKVLANLEKNQFVSIFGGRSQRWSGNSVCYREDKASNEIEIMAYLRSDWLGQGWVNISHPLRDAIVGRVWEIYANAFEHSHSGIGVFSCGQYYPNMQRLKLSVVDFGIGIPTNVRQFLNGQPLADETALKWAFQKGTTTKPNGISRGVGLDLLSEFVILNKGNVEYFSNQAYACINNGSMIFRPFYNYFNGTIVTITLTCDESHYCLASEIESTSPFDFSEVFS